MAARFERIRPAQIPLIAAAAVLALAVGLAGGKEARLALLVAVGVVFVALVLVNLKFGFAAMVMFSYLEVLSVLGGVSIAKLAGALIVVAWIAAASVRAHEERNFFAERPGLTYLVLAFLAWAVISTAWSQSKSLALESAMRYGLDACLIPIAYSALRDRRDVVHVFAAIVVGASIAALSAIASPPPPESAVSGRATGTVGDPNELAAALVVGMAMAGAFAVNRHIQPFLRAFSGFAVVLCLTGILMSLSRGGLIGVAAALLIAVIVGGRWRGRVLALCGAVLFGAAAYFTLFASLPAKERVLDVSGGGGSGRLDLWTVGLRMIEAHPLNGIGTGQFAISSVHYLLRPGLIESGTFILAEPKVAHNTYLNIVAELGVVGGVLFVAVLVFCLGCALTAVKRVREAGDERIEILFRGLVVGMGGFLVTLMFLSENYAKLLWILLAMGPVMLAVARAREPAAADRFAVHDARGAAPPRPARRGGSAAAGQPL